MVAVGPKMVASVVDPSEPKVSVVVAVAVAAAGVAVVAVAAVPVGVVAAVGLATVAAAAVLVGVVVASDPPKTCGSRCWRRGCCRQCPCPSRAPRRLASARPRELAAPSLPRMDPSAAFSAE